MSYLDCIVDAAILDLSGLPQDYFFLSESTDFSWIQAVFQALGLQFLLADSLQREPLHYIALHHLDRKAIAIQQQDRFVVYLLQPQHDTTEDFIAWAHSFQPEQLSSDPRFCASRNL